MATAPAKDEKIPLTPIPRREMSFEDFLAWAGDGEEGARWEWVDGEPVKMVSVNIDHARLVTFVSTLLGMVCGARGIGEVVTDTFLMRAAPKGNGRCPDILLVRREHSARFQKNYLLGAADLVVEVVSPGSIKTDYLKKHSEYQRDGVPEYWIIDPVERQTSFFVLQQDGTYAEARLNGNGRFASPAVDGLTFDPSWFHQVPLPNPIDILKDWGLL